MVHIRISAIEYVKYVYHHVFTVVIALIVWLVVIWHCFWSMAAVLDVVVNVGLAMGLLLTVPAVKMYLLCHICIIIHVLPPVQEDTMVKLQVNVYLVHLLVSLVHPYPSVLLVSLPTTCT